MKKLKTTGAAPAAPAPMAMPADFETGYSLPTLLERHDILTSVEGYEATDVAEAFVAAITEDDALQVTAFVRRIAWLMEMSRSPVVPVEDLVVPACLAEGVVVLGSTVRAADDLRTIEAIRHWAKDTVVDADASRAAA